ncbi:MAG TPA: bestrophin family ion channel [Pirellulales bacterium]|nr:bestrophin family ion channel [Pirellulales bacterium]
MIHYDRESWWRTVFSVRGTVLPHVLGLVGLLTGFTLVLCALDDYVFDAYGHPLPALDQLGHTVSGVALSMLIVFRTNSSAARYWEARTCWGGLINGSRNLARLASTYARPADRLTGMITAYVIALREHLRGKRDLGMLQNLIPARLIDQMTAANNPPTVAAAAISRWINQRRLDGAIDSIQAASMEQVLNSIVDNQGGCERIQRTPLPFVYAALIKQILFIYLATLPFVLINKMGYAAPLAVAVVAFGMLGIEQAGIAVESPFTDDPNALPLDQLCATVARDTTTLCMSDDDAVASGSSPVPVRV